MKVLDRPRADDVPPPPGDSGDRRRRVPGLLPLAIALTILGGMAVAVQSPARLWFEQRAEIADGQARIAAFDAEIADLERQAEVLRDPDAVELMAREEFLLSRPGDDVFVIRPLTTQIVDFPAGWPFAGFARLLGGP